MALEIRPVEKKDFDVFTLIRGNRRTKKSYVNKLRRILEANNGVIPNTREWIITINEKGQIVDGQCHWEAIQKYNEKHKRNPIVTIPCIVESGAGLDRAKEINNKNTKWKDSDLIQSWIDLGHEDFAVLKRILDTPEAKACGATLVYRICGDLDDSSIHKKIVDGTFRMMRDENDPEGRTGAMDIMRRVAICKDSLHHNFGDRSVSVPVFIKCQMIRELDLDRLTERVRCAHINLRGFRHANYEDGVLRNLNLVYNERLPRDERIDIPGLYEDRRAHNHINRRSAVRRPTLRTAPAPEPTPEPTPEPAPRQNTSFSNWRSELQQAAWRHEENMRNLRNRFPGYLPNTERPSSIEENGVHPV